MRFPLRKSVTTTGEPTVEYDRFGNAVTVPGESVDVPVFSWAVTRTEELGGDSVLRTVDHLEVIAPPGTFSPDKTITLPEGQGTWQVEGNPEDHNNNPWWSPGLVTYRAKKVDG